MQEFKQPNMRTKIFLSILVVFIAVLLYACGRPDATTHSSAAPINVSTTTQVSNLTATAPVAGPGSYIVDQSLKDSVTKAKLIVIADVIGMGGTFNSRRDNQDNTKPASDSFGVGQEYIVQVQRYLKGSGPNTLTVVQTEGAISTAPAAVTQADIERAKQASGVPPLVKGTRYLLLLKSLAAYHPGKDYYAGQGLPWRFALSADGNARMEAPREALVNIREDFIPHPDAPLLPQVEQLVLAEQNDTPTK